MIYHQILGGTTMDLTLLKLGQAVCVAANCGHLAPHSWYKRYCKESSSLAAKGFSHVSAV